jgi:ribonuclease P/MRP protein subunit RPP40
LRAYLHLNDIISPCQHGFQARRSAETQLLCSLDSWTKSLDAKLNVDVVYLDFSRAFDSVSHPKLLTVLENIGIKGRVFEWIKGFLSNRTQRVKINGVFSYTGSVSSGISQGSVLGPLLFNLYINDLPSVISPLCTTFLYADDCKVSFPYEDAVDTWQLQTELDKISAWASEKQLELAEAKCVFITLGHKVPARHGYFLNGKPLEQVHSQRDLGVTIDSKLNFNEHCTRIARQGEEKSIAFFVTSSVRILCS